MLSDKEGDKVNTRSTVTDLKSTVHWGFTCDACGQCPIEGVRFHKRDEDYDLCESEFHGLSPDEQRLFERMETPEEELDNIPANNIPQNNIPQNDEGDILAPRALSAHMPNSFGGGWNRLMKVAEGSTASLGIGGLLQKVTEGLEGRFIEEAAMGRDLENALLDSPALVNCTSSLSRHGYNPLIAAARNGHHQAVSVLLLHHADPDVRDWTGRTALDHAQLGGHSRVALLLNEALHVVNRVLLPSSRQQEAVKDPWFVFCLLASDEVIQLFLNPRNESLLAYEALNQECTKAVSEQEQWITAARVLHDMLHPRSEDLEFNKDASIVTSSPTDGRTDSLIDRSMDVPHSVPRSGSHEERGRGGHKKGGKGTCRYEDPALCVRCSWA